MTNPYADPPGAPTLKDMEPTTAALALGALAALTAVAALVLKRTPERARRVRDARPIDLSSLGIEGPGERATIVQFSTEMCARCPGVRRVISGLITPGVEFVHVDVTHRPEIASQFNLLQTPTVLLLDPAGRARTRLSGAISREALARELTELTSLAGGPHVASLAR